MSPIPRRLLVVPATAAALLLAATPAWAHVHVGAQPTGPGATDVTLTFHVPNEEAPARTTRVLVALPADHPLSGVVPQAGGGWTAQLAGSEITWTGGAIAGRDATDFRVRVAQLPTDTDTLTFKVLQTYDNGETVAWIETAAPGAPEPGHPAPVLDVRSGAAAGDDHGGHGGGDDAAGSGDQGRTAVVGSAPTAAAPAVPVVPAAGTATTPPADGSTDAALIGGVAGIAALGTLWGVLAWRRRRAAESAAEPSTKPAGDTAPTRSGR